MNENQKQSNFRPIKEREYRMFLIWKSLPVDFKKYGEEYARELGIDDEEILELFGIKTQRDFCKKFDVDETTLSTIWNKQKPPAEYQDIDWRIWAKKLTHNVMKKLYEGIIEDRDAPRIKLWLQAVDNFVEESKVNHDMSKETLDGVRTLIESLNNGKSTENNNRSDSGSDSRPTE